MDMNGIHNTNDWYVEIRLETVIKIVNQLIFYKDFVVHLFDRFVIISDEENNLFFSRSRC